MADKHDQTLMGILKDEGQVIPFLDSMFGFLYRCTDFFRLQHDPADKLGFPAGIAEQIVIKVLRKWDAKARLDDENYYRLRSSSTTDVPDPIQEETVNSEMSPSDEVTGSESACSSSEPREKIVDKSQVESTCDSYNGAVRNGYQWSQTISDLDAQVTVPDWVTKAKHVEVNIDADKLCVKLKTASNSEAEVDTDILLKGDLSFKTRKEESAWTLIPGKEIHIHLEKCQERWWESLLTTEEKIDLQDIDATRPIDDLPQEAQMKIQELMWTEQKKIKDGVEPRNKAVADLLKKAWNQKDSPFRGLDYNPKMINFDAKFTNNNVPN